jgi:hypothetical protein
MALRFIQGKPCVCGKTAFPTKRVAQRAVFETMLAKSKQRGGDGVQGCVYRCPQNAAAWHMSRNLKKQRASALTREFLDGEQATPQTARERAEAGPGRGDQRRSPAQAQESGGTGLRAWACRHGTEVAIGLFGVLVGTVPV